jgi:hypothetical protein
LSENDNEAGLALNVGPGSAAAALLPMLHGGRDRMHLTPEQLAAEVRKNVNLMIRQDFSATSLEKKPRFQRD